MREKSTLKGTYLRYFTLSILFLCLLPAMFGIGYERIQTALTWNRRNADDNTVNDSQLVLNYELKPALPQSRWVLRWDENSMNVHDISATMGNRLYNYNETLRLKTFLRDITVRISFQRMKLFFNGLI